MSFNSLGLSEPILNVISHEGFSNAYPIQKSAIPAIVNNKDVLGIAKTGSGKTASYVLPILNRLERKPKLANRHIHTLVLVPTRELAMQVDEVFKQFGGNLPYPVKSLAVYGGTSINIQMKTIQNVDILIATPGRLLDLINSNALHLDSLKTMVIDEADKMLNMGFKKQMDEIFELIPIKLQTLLFSATLSPAIENINSFLLNKPVILNLNTVAEPISPAEINQTGYFVTANNKGPLLRHLITSKNIKQVLVFTSSTYQTDLVAKKLAKHGIKAKAIHSKKTMGARKEALKQFKSNEISVLVTTDLLSRGIDIEFLPFVINYELPRSPKDFIHRIGRTGRAENKGEAITFVTEEDKHHFRVIQKKMKQWVTMVDSEKVL